MDFDDWGMGNHSLRRTTIAKEINMSAISMENTMIHHLWTKTYRIDNTGTI